MCGSNYPTSNGTTMPDDDHHQESITTTFQIQDLVDEIYRPFGTNRLRLRYTCSNVFETDTGDWILALGTTSGSVYLFQRNNDQQKFQSSISSSESSSISEISSPKITGKWQHHATIIAEDLIGPVTVVSFLPCNSMSDDFNGQENQDEEEESIQELMVEEETTINENQRKNFCWLSIGTGKGHLIIVRIIIDENPNPITTEIIYHCKNFTKNSIDLIRMDNCNRIFISDSIGQLFVLTKTEKFSIPTLLINLNGCTIHQFDVCDNYFLFSTNQNRVYYFNLETADCFQVGRATGSSGNNNGIKSSPPGVCIIPVTDTGRASNQDDDDDDLMIFDDDDDDDDEIIRNSIKKFKSYISRPKYRIWEVGHSGQVQFTHQFAQLIRQMPKISTTTIDGDSTGIFNSESTDKPNGGIENSIRNNSFVRLYGMRRNPDDDLDDDEEEEWFLVTYTQDRRVFVIDLRSSAIVAATPPLSERCLNIVQLQCIGTDIFVTYMASTTTNGIELQMAILTLNYRTAKKINSGNSSLVSDTIPQPQAAAVTSSGISSSEDIDNHPGEIPKTDPILSTMYEQISLYLGHYHWKTAVDAYNCDCGLPVNFGQPDCSRLADNREINRMASLVGQTLDTERLTKLIEMARADGNWPLYMALLVEAERPGDYLYHALLIGDSACLAVPYLARLWAKTRDMLRRFGADDHGWQTMAENLLEQIFQTPGHHSGPLSCQLCQLRNHCGEQNFSPVIQWLEQNLLAISLFYCSIDYIVKNLVPAVLNHFPGDQNLSPQWYLMLAYFKTMELGITAKSRRIIKHLEWQATKTMVKYEKPEMANSNILVHRLNGWLAAQIGNDRKKSNCTTTHTGFILNLRNLRCSYCDQWIVPRLAGAKCFRRQIKLYRSCGHVFHSGCTLVQYCSICNHHHHHN